MASTAPAPAATDPLRSRSRRLWRGRALALALALLVGGAGLASYGRDTERRVVAVRAADGGYAWSRGSDYARMIGAAGGRAIAVTGPDSRQTALAAYAARDGHPLWSRAAGELVSPEEGTVAIDERLLLITETSVYMLVLQL